MQPVTGQMGHFEHFDSDVSEVVKASVMPTKKGR
mgnify:FL=1